MIRVLLLALMLQGCTLLMPSSELRVTEYGGNGVYLTAYGEVAGCRVTREETIKGCLVYSGKHCTYESEGCK